MGTSTQIDNLSRMGDGARRSPTPPPYLAGDKESEGWVTHEVVLADLGDFCASRFLDAWYGREGSEWQPNIEPVPVDEPEEDPDFGGDLYRADGLHGLRYGGSRRAKR